MNPLTPTLLAYAFEYIGAPQVSPDGTRVAYLLSSTDLETKRRSSHIWVCGVDGAAKRRLTWGGDRNLAPHWSPDGSQLAFFRVEGASHRLLLLPMDGGEPREVFRSKQPVDDLAWSPDGASIACTSRFDASNPAGEKAAGSQPPVRVTSRVDYKADIFGFVGEARSQVFVVDVESGERRMLTEGPQDCRLPQWSPDGRLLAFRVSFDSGQVSRLAVVPAEGDGNPQFVTPPGGRVTTWAWSPDGSQILLSADPDLSSQSDFFLCDPFSGEARRLTDDLACLPDQGAPPLIPPSHPVWLDSSRALFHAFRAGASGLYELDIGSGSVALLDSSHEYRGRVSTDAGRRFVAQTVTSPEAVSELAVWDRISGKRTLLTTVNAARLADAPPARWERFEVLRGGLTIEAWMLMPPDFDPRRRYPIVLDVHGGPHAFHGYAFAPIPQCLATHGFIVICPNPRGSASYGRDFAARVHGDWGGEDYLDLLAVLDATQARPFVDTERTGIWGFSYGGYMTAWMLSQTERFAAAVCCAPCFDLESMYGTSDIGHSFGPRQWGGTPDDAGGRYAKRSPSSFAGRIRTPTLIMQGEADQRCPVGQSEQMFVALKQHGCEAEFVRYPGQSHFFLTAGPAEYREDAIARILAWFQRYLA